MWLQFVVISFVFYTAFRVLMKVFSNKKVDPKSLTIVSFLIASVLSLIFIISTAQFTWSPSAVLLSLITGTIVFYAFYERYKALKKLPGSLVIPVTELHMVIAAILSIFLFNEVITLTKIISAIFAGISLIIVNREVKK